MKTVLVSAALMLTLTACDTRPLTTDERQAAEQAQALEQAHAQIGMPAIGDFQEKRELKEIYEKRDKPLPTHSYIVNDMNGCLVYLGASMGYGLPYATQYTASTRVTYVRPGGSGSAYYVEQVPQAEPNGLFMPTSAEGTWLQLKGPDGEVKPVYVESRVLVSPFRLTAQECPPTPPPAKK